MSVGDLQPLSPPRGAAAPRLVVADPLGQRLEVLALLGPLLGDDHQQAERGLDEAAAGQSQVGRAPRGVADLLEPEADGADLQEVADDLDGLVADRERPGQLALSRAGAGAGGGGRESAARVLVDVGREIGAVRVYGAS